MPYVPVPQYGEAKRKGWQAVGPTYNKKKYIFKI
jgi:hypothetical protein